MGFEKRCCLRSAFAIPLSADVFVVVFLSSFLSSSILTVTITSDAAVTFVASTSTSNYATSATTAVTTSSVAATVTAVSTTTTSSTSSAVCVLSVLYLSGFGPLLSDIVTSSPVPAVNGIGTSAPPFAPAPGIVGISLASELD